MRRLLVVAGSLLLVAACGAPGPGSSPSRTTSAPTSPPASVATPSSSAGSVTSTPSRSTAPTHLAAGPGVSKVLVVLLENHDVTRALRQMPHLASLGSRYGEATEYYGVTHPSLPNYLMIAGGSTAGVHDDKPPSVHVVQGPSVFGQMLAHGGTARTYADAMVGKCRLRDGGRYAVKHNPWAYFADERSACKKHDVPSGTPRSGALATDIAHGSLPNMGLLIPDMCHDAHDCSLATADAWLKPWLTALTAGRDFTTGRLAVVVTFDEDDRSNSNHIAAVVLHRDLHHARTTRRMDHRDLSATLSALAGQPPLRHAAGRRNLLTALGLAMAKPTP